MNLCLTCWPLDAIGVDLNRQNQQKGAGVHRVDVLVHFKRAEGIISFTPSGPGAQVVESSPSIPPLPSDWSFRHTEGNRAELVLQTDVRVNSSGERFRREARFSADAQYEPGASKWPRPATTPWCRSVDHAQQQTLCVCLEQSASVNFIPVAHLEDLTTRLRVSKGLFETHKDLGLERGLD